MQDSDPVLIRRGMRRIPRWWLIPGAVIVVLAGLGAAYWAGASTTAVAEPMPPLASVVPVSATVERRAVANQVVLSGKVIAGAQATLQASPAESVDRLVVTAVAKEAGSAVVPGEVLAVVSGRPLLILPSSVPLYRDIGPEDSGPDVEALQTALANFGYACTTTGTFDLATQQALGSWYKAAGYKAPAAPDPLPQEDAGNAAPSNSSDVMFRWREFVQVPGDTGTVASIAGTGSILAEDGIVARIRVADDSIVARADVVQSESFVVGTPVTVRAGSTVLDTAVVRVSNFLEGDQSKSEIPGKDITVALPPGTQGFAADQSVTMTAGSAVAESLAVPLIAIRQDGGTAYLLVEGNSEPRRLEVKVTAQADGWAAIADVDGLVVGDQVKLQ
ncbi:peptidoglycan-binding protein [Paenarthrobacter aurescens]|uniref:peptidoglycan-binding protein n=1 Tax=Paenarthrobacter aurescens TaxID=43663 RepID=UPI0021BFD71D|nr:peptidoglycan-binding protein [Paenarthrobacter aurescens]MCT9868042.1 peptidoglycan-binding protein [Paenarthrobacter aurescens]